MKQKCQLHNIYFQSSSITWVLDLFNRFKHLFYPKIFHFISVKQTLLQESIAILTGKSAFLTVTFNLFALLIVNRNCFDAVSSFSLTMMVFECWLFRNNKDENSCRVVFECTVCFIRQTNDPHHQNWNSSFWLSIPSLCTVCICVFLSVAICSVGAGRTVTEHLTTFFVSSILFVMQ